MFNDNEYALVIDSIGARNEKAKQLTKECKKDIEKLKTLMKGDEVYLASGSDYTAKLSVYTVDSLNEDKLFTICKSCPELNGTIKTKEYVDMDELERLLYSEEVPNSVKAELATCYVPEERTRLTLAKKKREEE